MPTSRPAAVVSQTSKTRQEKQLKEHLACWKFRPCPHIILFVLYRMQSGILVSLKLIKKLLLGNADDINVRTRLADRF